MGLINWEKEERELQVDVRKDENRRNIDHKAMINENTPKEWGIDFLLDKKQILEVENLGEELLVMAERFNRLTGVYADLYRSTKEKWERELKDKQQLEEIDLSALNENKEKAPIDADYNNRVKRLDEDFNSWVAEKKKEFADKRQARANRFEDEKKELENPKPFHHVDYYKGYYDVCSKIKECYYKAENMLEERAKYRILFKKDILERSYRYKDVPYIKSVSDAMKALTQEKAEDAEELLEDIDYHLSDVWHDILQLKCVELGELVAEAEKALEILRNDYETSFGSNQIKIKDQYDEDCRSINREEMEWEAYGKTEKRNQIDREKERLLKEANDLKKKIEDRYKGKKEKIRNEYERQRESLKKSRQDELTGLIKKYRDHMEVNYPKAVLRKQYETMAAELDTDLQKRKELKTPRYNIAVGRVFMPLETGADIDGEFAEEAAGFLRKAYPVMISDVTQIPKLVFPYFVSPDKGTNLLFSYRKDNKEDRRLSRIINTIGMRFLLSIPAYMLQFCLIDGTGIGTFSSIAGVDPSQDKASSRRIKGILAGGDVKSKEAQIRDTVNSIRTELNVMTRSLRQYNRENVLDSKPYRVMMIQHFPDRIDRETIENLAALSGMEGQRGFSSVITVPERAEREAKEDTRQLISAVRANMEELHPEKHPVLGTVFVLEKVRGDFMNRRGYDKPFLVIDGEEELNSRGYIEELAALLSEECRQYGKKELTYAGIMSGGEGRPGKSAAAGASVVLGRGLEGQPFMLNFNDAYVHTVVSGALRAGKSNLLRTAVTGILQDYKAGEIELYVVDYKRGVDYNALSDIELPQLRMISMANVPAFVNLILDEVGKEMSRRASLISGKMNIDEYNRKHPEEPLKRIILVIDELYELLQGTKGEQEEEITGKINSIAHQSGAFGVHMILASQHITKIEGIGDAIEMCANRIIFNTEDDISRFVAPGALSTAEEFLRSIGPEDKGACVFTNDFGQSVRQCQAAMLDAEEQEKILREIERKYSTEKKYTRILLAQPDMCGRHPLTRFCRQGELAPVIEYYEKDRLLRETFCLWIGQTLEPSTAWGVEAPEGSLWMIGGEGEAEKAGISVMFYALVSLVMEKCRRKLKGGDLTILYCDALDESTGMETEEGSFVRDAALCGEYWDYYPGLGWNEEGEETGLPECIMKLSEEVEKRCMEKSGKEASGMSVSFEPLWMLMNRMETNSRFSPRHMDALRKAVRKGKEVNVHVIVWTKTPDRNDEIKLYEEAKNPKVLQTLVLETGELKEFRMERQGLEASGYQAQLIAPAGKGKRLRVYDLLDNNREDMAKRLSEKNFSICDENNVYMQM